MRGIVPIGYTVFALVLGVAHGIVIRRPLPALALTLAVFTFVQIAMPLWIRPHLVTPVTKNVTFTMARLDSIEGNPQDGILRISLNTGGRGDWLLSNKTVDATGPAAALPAWATACRGHRPRRRHKWHGCRVRAHSRLA